VIAPDVRTPPARGANAEDNTDAAILPQGPDARRELAARAIQAGFQLHELAGGELLLTRWGLSRSLADAHAVGRFLDLVTGVRS
jgi:hypothetical protein